MNGMNTIVKVKKKKDKDERLNKEVINEKKKKTNKKNKIS